MSAQPQPSIREKIERDGYAILPGFFSPEDIERLKRILNGFFQERGALYHLGKTQPNAAMECADLAHLFSSPRVVAAFREAFGDDDILFTGHCDIHQDMFSNWHKDTGDDTYFTEDCYVPDCRVYKMAVYLQDHQDGNGLTVRPGTHHHKAIGEGEGLPLLSRAGDAVIFDVRLSHRGRLPAGLDRPLHLASKAIKKALGPVVPSLRGPGDVAAIYRIRKALDAAGGRPTRMSVFFTFGAVNRFSYQFAKANMERQLRQYRADGGVGYPGDLVEKLTSQGVKVYLGEGTAAAAP